MGLLSPFVIFYYFNPQYPGYTKNYIVSNNYKNISHIFH